ncbi:MAG: hypothetical protein ACP5G1_04310 [Nanopusillaceae archaeon]
MFSEIVKLAEVINNYKLMGPIGYLVNHYNALTEGGIFIKEEGNITIKLIMDNLAEFYPDEVDDLFYEEDCDQKFDIEFTIYVDDNGKDYEFEFHDSYEYISHFKVINS